MANTANINVRVDATLKRQAESIFSELGLNLSTAMNIFLRSAVRYGGIPFDLKVSQKPPALEAMSKSQIDTKLEAGLASMKAGKGRPAKEFFDDFEREYSFENVVIISLDEYNSLIKAARNAAYLDMIDRSIAQLAGGEGKPHELIEVDIAD